MQKLLGLEVFRDFFIRLMLAPDQNCLSAGTTETSTLCFHKNYIWEHTWDFFINRDSSAFAEDFQNATLVFSL